MDLLLSGQTFLHFDFSSSEHERSQYLMELADHMGVLLLGLPFLLLLVGDPVIEGVSRGEYLWNDEIH